MSRPGKFNGITIKNENVIHDEISIFTLANILDLEQSELICAYRRGSRAIGTFRENSDHDFVAVFEKAIDGHLIKDGNIDISTYTPNYFIKILEEQCIWALEAIYCPTELIIVENINYREYVENYRENNLEKCNSDLIHSVGLETALKISVAKKYKRINNLDKASKHLFIAVRFSNYGVQIKNDGKIDIKSVNNLYSNFDWDGWIKIIRSNKAKLY